MRNAVKVRFVRSISPQPLQLHRNQPCTACDFRVEALVDLREQHPIWEEIREKKYAMPWRKRRRYYWYDNTEYLREFKIHSFVPEWMPWGNDYFAPKDHVFKVGEMIISR